VQAIAPIGSVLRICVDCGIAMELRLCVAAIGQRILQVWATPGSWYHPLATTMFHFKSPSVQKAHFARVSFEDSIRSWGQLCV